jgi:hypothetical protein
MLFAAPGRTASRPQKRSPTSSSSSAAAAAASSSSPPPRSAAASASWRSSPLGHAYRKFESEWNAHGSNRTAAENFGAPVDEAGGAQARIIWFIERCRQLELAVGTLHEEVARKAKAERRHAGDISDLRKLVNELCEKVRAVQRERDGAVKRKSSAEVKATQMEARLKAAQLDASKYKNADSRMHTLLVNSNRDLQEARIRAEALEEQLEIERKRATDAEADAVEHVAEVEKRTAAAVDAANARAEEILEELRGIQGGWQEMKMRADASQEREEASLRQAEARIAMAENGSKVARAKAEDAAAERHAAVREAAELRRQLADLQDQVMNRTEEVETLRRGREVLVADMKQKTAEMSDLQARLHEKARALRDENRQARVQHVKFIDRRIKEKKEKEEARLHPKPKVRKPSKKQLERERRATQRAEQRAAHKAKVLAARKKLGH